ncbi:hypothetical protein H5410_053091 [Solanum commersonii]|uniref:Uncharacterized protein n=1 Tax=Solanum commersonii TaxID=4109 RepID=A0A9J5X629_SOLCO|nr:hypothetical protein H5410_053091 [Solanum commersonii]
MTSGEDEFLESINSDLHAFSFSDCLSKVKKTYDGAVDDTTTTIKDFGANDFFGAKISASAVLKPEPIWPMAGTTQVITNPIKLELVGPGNPNPIFNRNTERLHSVISESA